VDNSNVRIEAGTWCSIQSRATGKADYIDYGMTLFRREAIEA
jgi:hypothetical protein